jgi:hypothetical protein
MPATGNQDLPIYQIKIELLHTEIWRRVLIPREFTLRYLHNVIQVVMGWDDQHMHEFTAGKQIYGDPELDRDSFLTTGGKDERKVLVSEIFLRVRSKALYTYDFGDDWQHSLVLEARLKPEPDMVYPVCVGGEKAGPPEDCGGLPGYYNLLEGDEGMLEWLDREYDPDAFSLELVNRKLEGLRPRRRRR